MFIDAFLERAWLAGLGLTLITGPLGCFVTWRRMAYFGDALAHSSLLGVAGGLALSLTPRSGILVSCAIFAVLVALLQRRRTLAGDTALGIAAHAGLALGVVVLSLTATTPVDLHAYLFGDILSVATDDLWLIAAIVAVTWGVLALLWRALLVGTLHPDLARVEGMRTFAAEVALIALLALVVAVSIQIVGVLLVTAMLIIPAATARALVRSPEGMAALAVVLGAFAVTAGLWLSLRWDVPTGPAMVVVASAVFALSLALPRRA